MSQVHTKFQVQNKQIRDTKTQAWTLSSIHIDKKDTTVYMQDHPIEMAYVQLLEYTSRSVLMHL